MPKASGPVPDTAYHDTGGLQSRGFTLDGEMHGAWAFYRKDGSVMRTGEFDRGRQVGIWRTFDRSGRLVKETDSTEAWDETTRADVVRPRPRMSAWSRH